MSITALSIIITNVLTRNLKTTRQIEQKFILENYKNHWKKFEKFNKNSVPTNTWKYIFII